MALYIGLAAFGGLLLLSILVIILYKYVSAEPNQKQSLISPNQSGYHDSMKSKSGGRYHQVPMNSQEPSYRRTPYSPSSGFPLLKYYLSIKEENMYHIIIPANTTAETTTTTIMITTDNTTTNIDDSNNRRRSVQICKHTILEFIV
ncbi:unnamed protein product [Trichobilharzia regenti]|nr:unnamed protein product [Trichobilharzia regenti]